jgi:hypothetical protein
MSSDVNEPTIIGTKSKFPRYIATGFVYVLGTWFLGFVPYKSNKYLLFSVPLAILSFIITIWWFRKPNAHLKHFVQISASALLALIAFRCASYVLPQISVLIAMLMIFGFVFVHTLEFWSISTAAKIGDEIYAPKTWIGKLIFRVILFIAPLAAVGGSLVGKAVANENPMFIFLAGLLAFFFAYLIPFPSLSRYATKGTRIPITDKIILGQLSRYDKHPAPQSREPAHKQRGNNKRKPRNTNKR